MTSTNEEIASCVFQCRQCRSILADSYHLLTIDPDTLTVAAVHCVKVGGEGGEAATSPVPQTGQTELDNGCTFVPLTCTHCSAVVGRQYKTTTARLDHAR